MRIGLLHSARMTPRIPDPVPVTQDSPWAVRPGLEGRVWSGSQGTSLGRTGRDRMVGVGRASCSFPATGRMWVRCSVLDRAHATPSTRGWSAPTDGVALAGEIVTGPRLCTSGERGGRRRAELTRDRARVRRLLMTDLPGSADVSIRRHACTIQGSRRPKTPKSGCPRWQILAAPRAPPRACERKDLPAPHRSQARGGTLQGGRCGGCPQSR
jgi:hypothetical protein